MLYNNLRDKSRALSGKEVADIVHGSDGVTVWCSDLSSYSGDIVVGSDGVFSKTREKMWQLAEAEHPALVEADRKCRHCNLAGSSPVSPLTGALS